MSRRDELMNCPAYTQDGDYEWIDDQEELDNVNAARMQGVCVDDMIIRLPPVCIDFTKRLEEDEKKLKGDK